METVTVTRIPFADKILNGEWYDPTYLISTEGLTFEEHDARAEAETQKIIDEYNKNNHSSVSLRYVKHELIHSFESEKVYATLVQLRVRDSF